MLGGFWWEGHPFQTGAFSTLDVPVPTWRDGSIPVGGGYPVIGPCTACGRIHGAALSSARMVMVRLDNGDVADVPTTMFHGIGDFYEFTYAPFGGSLGQTVIVQTLSCSLRMDVAFAPSFLVPNRSLVEDPPPFADYLGTWQWDNALVYWTDGSQRHCMVQLRIAGM